MSLTWMDEERRAAKDQGRDPKGFFPHSNAGTPMEAIDAAARPYRNVRLAPAKAPEVIPPFAVSIEIPCDDCGGDGVDVGGLDPVNRTDCRRCQGTGKETLTRSYLAEAFAIAREAPDARVIQREHLVALAAYAKLTASSLSQNNLEVSDAA